MSIAFQIVFDPERLEPDGVNKYIIKFMNRGTKQQIRNQSGIGYKSFGAMRESKKTAGTPTRHST